MNFQSNIDHTIFEQIEPLSELYPYKEDQQDRSTNHLTSDDNYQFYNAFEVSPHRGSYFFTPNSPRPLQLQLTPSFDQQIKRNGKSLRCSLTNNACITKKLNLEQQQCDQIDEERQSSSSNNDQPIKISPNRSSRNAKGLRNLAESVYIIVSELSITKYKQVADRLVGEISIDNETGVQKTKDQHNIKRRVYDALNVLIAAGLLRKQGKMVACNEPYIKLKTKFPKNPKQSRQKQKLQIDIRKKIQILKQKRQKFQRLEYKKNLIEFIINRNKQKNISPESFLQFPLIGMMINEDSLTSKQSTTEKIKLKLKEKPLLYGDVDLLLQINRDHQQMDNLLNNICSQGNMQQIKYEE